MAAYTNYGTEIRYADYERAIRLYQFLIGKGFSSKFLGKRYLIDIITEEKKHDDGINPILNKINYLQRVDEINALRDKDCDVEEEIRKIINADYKKIVDEEEDKTMKAKIETPEDYLSLVSNDEISSFLGGEYNKKEENESDNNCNHEMKDEYREENVDASTHATVNGIIDADYVEVANKIIARTNRAEILASS